MTTMAMLKPIRGTDSSPSRAYPRTSLTESSEPTLVTSSELSPCTSSSDMLSRHNERSVLKPIESADSSHHPRTSLTESSEQPTLVTSELSRPSSSDKISRHVERSVLKRMKLSDSFSSLPKRHVATLTWDDLHVGEFLDCGGFSSVFQVSLRLEEAGETSHQPCMDNDITTKFSTLSPYSTFALKRLGKKASKKGADRLSQAAADLASEANLLSRLNHENIIHLHGMSDCCPSTCFDNKQGFFLVLDLLEETLHTRLERWRHDQHNHLLERLETTALGVANGMDYLHRNRICFRDLKPRNIGYDATTGQVKILDFGLACEQTSPETTRRTMVGTFRYMAPEVLLHQGYGLPCDVYSFGIILWHISSLQRKYAYKCKSNAEFLKFVVKRGGRPSLKSLVVPKEIKTLIRECWHADPRLRPTFDDIRDRLENVISAQPMGETDSVPAS